MTQNVELDELAQRIRAAQQSIAKNVSAALTKAMDAGDALIAAKAKLKHGGWMKWLEANCDGLSGRTARVWMQLAENRGVIEAKLKLADAANFTISGALELLKPDDDDDEEQSDEPEPEAEESDNDPEPATPKASKDIHTVLEFTEPDELATALRQDWPPDKIARLVALIQAADQQMAA
jgi:Protein of unknown function (DUF3102)